MTGKGSKLLKLQAIRIYDSFYAYELGRQGDATKRSKEVALIRTALAFLDRESARMSSSVIMDLLVSVLTSKRLKTNDCDQCASLAIQAARSMCAEERKAVLSILNSILPDLEDIGVIIKQREAVIGDEGKANGKTHAPYKGTEDSITPTREHSAKHRAGSGGLQSVQPGNKKQVKVPPTKVAKAQVKHKIPSTQSRKTVEKKQAKPPPTSIIGTPATYLKPSLEKPSRSFTSPVQQAQEEKKALSLSYTEGLYMNGDARGGTQKDAGSAPSARSAVTGVKSEGQASSFKNYSITRKPQFTRPVTEKVGAALVPGAKKAGDGRIKDTVSKWCKPQAKMT